jgi:hypothetical protein
MTVNELITQLDLMPADSEVHLALNGGGELDSVTLVDVAGYEMPVVVLDIA